MKRKRRIHVYVCVCMYRAGGCDECRIRVMCTWTACVCAGALIAAIHVLSIQSGFIDLSRSSKHIHTHIEQSQLFREFRVPGMRPAKHTRTNATGRQHHLLVAIKTHYCRSTMPFGHNAPSPSKLPYENEIKCVRARPDRVCPFVIACWYYSFGIHIYLEIRGDSDCVVVELNANQPHHVTETGRKQHNDQATDRPIDRSTVRREHKCQVWRKNTIA